MRVAIGCDHIVTDVKDRLRNSLIEKGFEVFDVGTYDQVRTHYPIYGTRVGETVANGVVDFGICLCGTGVGISNSAQKVKGTRVALVRDVKTAELSRKLYDANIISFGGRVIGYGTIEELVEVFLSTKYEGNNNEMIDKINQLGNEEKVSFDSFLEKWDRGFYHD